MAAFVSMQAAESFARTKMADGTYIETHVQRDKNGTISVRALRKVSLAVASGAGDWIIIVDDA